jgi:soluble lytic murein transglycosylase
MARAATRLVGALLIALASAAHADPAAQLGTAYAAYDRGDLAGARAALAGIDADLITNRDYLFWLRGMVALRLGDAKTARDAFAAASKIGSSRYKAQLPWRLADCDWLAGNRKAAAAAYDKLIEDAHADDDGDVGTAMFRIAEARDTAKTAKAAIAAYRAMLVAHPANPLAARAEQRILALGGDPTPTPAERIARAQQLTDAHLWDDAVAELEEIPADVAADTAHQRDYWLGMTLFKMRRRYADAGQLLLGVYKFLDETTAAGAMFHGARALSRADRDDDAIRWYKQVVASYPSTAFAQEAQFLSGWLEFNRGHYKDAIAPLEKSLEKYPSSKFVDDSLWFLAMSHYFLGEWKDAKAKLTQLSQRRGALEGGKGEYWLARLDQRLGAADLAITGYKDTVTHYPLSWYALLARARLAALGVKFDVFGDQADAPKGPKLAAAADEKLADDSLIERADELIAAGLGVDAGFELARGEHGFLKRHDRSGAAFAMMLDRYHRAGNYNRPWMLAVSYSGDALDGHPTGDARRWWENAYPRAYRELVEKYQALGDNPDGYLYSIMRKESGFDPHDLSYADAQGLLQMIPPTTQRVAATLGIPYDDGNLYEPAYNVETGSWYIGHLLAKFKRQIPIGAGSFNSGPKPVMKWLDQNGDREIDELVELVPYTQTREYMKKVTENFARYELLYDHEIYEQPLTVDKHYVVDRLTY